MKFKEYLKNLIASKEARAKELKTKVEGATTVDEVRSLGNDLRALEDEIRDAKAQLNAIEAEEARNALPTNEPTFDPSKATNVATANMGNATRSEEDPHATMDYRKAFMNYVQKGTTNALLKRDTADQNEASDLGVLLPTTVIQEIIKGVEKVYGQLYSRVRKTNIKGGVKYPIGSFSATFKRITETTVSVRQAAGGVSNDAVVFSYNIGEIRLAQTLLASVLSVPVFEAELAKVIVEAYVKAMDKEIMLGDSTDNECEGILTEANKVSSRIDASHIIEFTEAEMADWKEWQKKLFAIIPLSMRGLRPEFVMTSNTYESNIKTLHDDNNRPVYNETFNPVDGAEISRFKGRDVVFVENDILDDFDTASNGDYFAMYWVPEQAYAINTNMEFYVKRYFDDETNQYVDKALVINDGKVLDPKYIYLLKKKIVG